MAIFVAGAVPVSAWAASEPVVATVKPTRIVADPSAPGSQRPTVLTAPNGIPLVNLQAPSAAGVSRNTYRQFDVGAQGVILNNSRSDTATQLGGWVQGNPWMGRGEARVILNEVNSSAASQLNGYVEVAGRRAEVIIANPAGIQVNGGGFINASSATLTTGAPQFDAVGRVSGFAVQGGLIRIDGAGLDARSTEYTALLSRAVELNAGFWAQAARIQTGTQVMPADQAGTAQQTGEAGMSGEAVAPIGDRPRYALDSTALGGIYAQQITLVGTEAGLGVRQGGQIVGGHLTLRADGWLENTGSVYAEPADASGTSSLQVSSGQGVRNAGWMASQGSVAVTAPQLQSTSGSLMAAGLAPDGHVEAGPAALTLTASTAQQHAGQLLAASRIDLQASSTPQAALDLSGAQAKSAVITMTGEQVTAQDATFIASERLSVLAGSSVDLSNTQAQARDVQVAGGVIRMDGAALSATHGLQVAAADRLSATGASLMADTLTVSAHQADLSRGEFLHTGAQALALRMDGALTADGARIATNARDMSLHAASISAREARIEHYGAGGLTLRSGEVPSLPGGALDLGDARVMTAGRFEMSAAAAVLDRADVVAQSVDWSAGQLSHAQGRTQIAGTEASRVVSLGGLDNRLGRIESNSSLLTLHGAAVDNRGGVLSSVGHLSVDAKSLSNQAGLLLANQRLAIGGAHRPMVLDNIGGQIGAADVALAAGQVLNAGGVVSASAAAVVDVDEWQHGDGGIEANTLDVHASHWEGAGTVYARGDATLTTGTLRTAGVLGAGGALQVKADQVLASGLIAAGLQPDGMLVPAGPEAAPTDPLKPRLGAGMLTLQASALANTGALQSSGAADLTVSGAFNNAGVVYGQGDVSLRAGHLLNPGTVAAQGDLAVRTTRLEGSGGLATGLRSDNTLAAQGRLAIEASGQLQFSGALTSASELSATGAVLELQGAHLQAGATHLHATEGDLSVQGATMAAADLSLTARRDLITSRAQVRAGQISLAARDWINAEGHVTQTTADGSLISTVSRDLHNQSGTIESAGRTLTLSAATVDNTAGRIAQAGGDLRLQAHDWNGAHGQVLALGSLDWAVVDGLTLTGAATQADRIHLQAGRLTHDAAQMLSAQDMALRLNGDLNNQGGTLASGAALSIQTLTGPRGASGVGGLDNRGGSLVSKRALDIRSASLSNEAGRVASLEGSVSVDTAGAEFNNRGGQVLSSEAMTVRSGALDNFGGLLQSNQSLTIQTAGAALLNTLDASVLTLTGLRADGALHIDAGAVENSAAIDGAAVTLNAASLTNRDTVSGQTLALNLLGRLDNRGGQLVGRQSTTATAGDILNQSGLIYGGQTLDLRAVGLLDNSDTSGASPGAQAANRDGQEAPGASGTASAANQGIQGGAVTLAASQLDNRFGQVRASEGLHITATQSLDNSDGLLSGQGRTEIGDGSAQTNSTALSVTNASGTVWGGTGLTVRAASLTGGGEFSSGGSLAMVLGGDLTHGAGALLQAGGDIGLTLGGSFVNEGILRSGGALDIQAQNIDNRASGELSSVDTHLSATQALTNRGLIDGERVRISADQLSNLGTGRIYGSDLTLAGAQLSNAAENGQGAVIASRGDLRIHMTGAVSNSDEALIFADRDLHLTAADVDNRNATLEATRLLQMDVSGTLTNRSLHEDADALPQDPAAPRVLASKAFLRSGGDMRLTTGQLINSGATVEARGNLLLQSADIQNLNPYLKWQRTTASTTSTWEFQAPGSTLRYSPDEIRVLSEVTYNGIAWYSLWGSEAKASLEPFVKNFRPQTSNWSQDTYNRKLLLPSERYPNEIFARYLGGTRADESPARDRAFEWRPSADHSYETCNQADVCRTIFVPGAHYPADDRVWSDFGVAPGDDHALDQAVAAFYADVNSRLVSDFTAFHTTRTSETAKVTQSAAGQIIVGGTLGIEGGRIRNEMSRIVGRDGVVIHADAIDNRSPVVKVSGTEVVDVYATYNGGSETPNTGIRYAQTSAQLDGTVTLTLPDLHAVLRPLRRPVSPASFRRIRFTAGPVR